MKNLRSRNAPRLFEKTTVLLKTIRMHMYSIVRKRMLNKPRFALIRSCSSRSIFGLTLVARESPSKRARTATADATNKLTPGKISPEQSSLETCPLWSVKKNLEHSLQIAELLKIYD